MTPLLRELATTCLAGRIGRSRATAISAPAPFRDRRASAHRISRLFDVGFAKLNLCKRLFGIAEMLESPTANKVLLDELLVDIDAAIAQNAADWPRANWDYFEAFSRHDGLLSHAEQERL